MKVRKLKHRVIVTPWVRWDAKRGRRIVRAPMSYRLSRSVIPFI